MIEHQEIIEKIEICAYYEKRKLKEPFIISRHTFHHSLMMIVELKHNGLIGRGECEPHEYDIEIVKKAVDYSNNLAKFFKNGMSINKLNEILPSGPIRNAFDCALWDLIAKTKNKRIWEILNLKKPTACPTVFTLSIEPPKIMAQKAKAIKNWNKLKIKLGGIDLKLDIERVKAIREARPDCELIVDANGAWTMEILQNMANQLALLNVKLIEQPLLNGHDDELLGYNCPVPLCADESCLDTSSLDFVCGRYQYINIKLDKTGGLTEALKLYNEAKKQNIGIMVGCMAGTSLAMAPAFLLAQFASFIDLDGPMLLEEDREYGMKYENGLAHPFNSLLWG